MSTLSGKETGEGWGREAGGGEGGGRGRENDFYSSITNCPVVNSAKYHYVYYKTMLLFLTRSPTQHKGRKRMFF